MIAKKYIVFDMGKTKILASVLKLGRKSYNFVEMAEYKNPRNPERVRKIIMDFCHSARAKFWTKKVAISAAHLVDPEKKTVSQGKACYGAEFFDFRFLEVAGFSVKIENDGRCFALGEYYFGKGQKAKSIFTLTLGTEVGGGFIVDGNNYRGSHNSSLEVSNISANYLGKWTRWADLCAGKGIENSYKNETGEKFTAKEIFLKARKNNKTAKEIIGKTADILGMGTASLVNVLDPEIIIFGGNLSRQKKFVGKAVETARKNVFNKKANYKFAISSLGNKANLLGAAANFREK